MNNKWTILITGGTGYIGSHAVVAFEQAWYKTVIVDSLINSSESILIWINKILGYTPDFYAYDIRDKDKLRTIFKQYSFDGVIHFAGLKAVWESCEKPFLYYDNNVIGSIHLFEVMEEFGIRNIIFSSSATVYDTNNTLPLTEKSQLGTTNPYWTSKLILENILKDLVVTKNWKTIALRYFNPIGAHSSWYIWEQPNWIPNNLLPYILEVAVGKREYVWIFGNDYETMDGTGVRDYIDINDLIEAHIAAIKNLSIQSKSYFSAINIGTWQGKSVLEMIQGVENASGKKIPYTILPRRHGDIASVYADSSLAKELLGWEAKKTIHESIESSWKFITHKN